MPDFYATFGVQYPRNAHPYWGAAHSDGYVTIKDAPTRQEAHKTANYFFGQAWSNLYDDPPDPQFAPLGEIGRIYTGDDGTLRIQDAREYRFLPEEEPLDDPVNGSFGGGIWTTSDWVQISDKQGRKVFLSWAAAVREARTILDAAELHGA